MVKDICQRAKRASRQLVTYHEAQINQLLLAIADALEKHISDIEQANQRDIEQAKANGISNVMIDRLALNLLRINTMASDVRKVANLPSPINRDLAQWSLDNGLIITKKSVPFGVVGIIYESRPNVTVDAAVLALKSNNAIVLKGGKEAYHSNLILTNIIKKVCQTHKINPDCIGFIDSTDRKHTEQLLSMKQYVDVLIPRGSAKLINWVSAHAKVPVLETGAGNCHLFIDQSADFDMALTLIDNAKTQRPSVCNALEKVLIHQSIAQRFCNALKARLSERVTFRVDNSAQSFFNQSIVMSESERYEEYLGYILGVVVVNDLNAAIDWINTYSSHHSDGIVTENIANAQRFMTIVDSAAVYHDASTRFTDGGQFGFGAEIGIATSKLHARGPMALNELTTYKYWLNGQGQVRD